VNDDPSVDGCAYAFLLAGLAWVVILVAAAVILSRVLP
jgi:hypothetical protein